MQSSSGVFFSPTGAARAAAVTAALAAAAAEASEGRANCDRQQSDYVRHRLRVVPPYLTPDCDPCSSPRCTPRATLCRAKFSTGKAPLAATRRRGSQVTSQSSCSDPTDNTANHGCPSRLYRLQPSHAGSTHNSIRRTLKATGYCESNIRCYTGYPRFDRIGHQYSHTKVVPWYGTRGASGGGVTWSTSKESSARESAAGTYTGIDVCRVSSAIHRFCNERISSSRSVARKDVIVLHLSRQTEGCIRGLRKRIWGSLFRTCRQRAARCNAEVPPLGTAGQAATDCHYHVSPHSRYSPDISVTAPAGVRDLALLQGSFSAGAVHSNLSSVYPPVVGRWLSYLSSGRWSCFKLKNISPPTGGSELEASTIPRGTGGSHASTAQRLTVQPTRDYFASCADVGAAIVDDGAAAAANDKDASPRSPREDGEVDLVAEVARAIEGLSRLQDQRNGQLQVRQPEAQYQKARLIGGHRLSEAPTSACGRWRQPDLTDEDFQCLNKRWLALLTRLRPYGHISTGNRVKLFDDGDKAFTAMLRDIDQAENTVLLETYMFDASLPACRVKDALCEAAQRGCFVVLIIDWVGSFNMPHAWKEELLNSGVHLVIFNPRFFLPVFSGNRMWPRELAFGVQQNVFSPAIRFLQSLCAPHHVPASSQLLSQVQLPTGPNRNSNSSSRGGEGGGASRHGRQAPGGSTAENGSAIGELSGHTTSEGKLSARPRESVFSRSEAGKDDTARAGKESGDTQVEARSGIAADRTKKGTAAEETSTQIPKVNTHIYVMEDSARLESANSKAERERSRRGAVSSGAAALGEVRTLDAAPGKNTNATISESEVPKRLLWAIKVGPVPFRDHRKILIVDSKSAFTGSLNISEDGVGKQYGGRGFFYDLHARLRGPAVQHLQQLVFETLETCGASELAEELHCHLTAVAERQGQASFTQEMLLCEKQHASIQRGKEQSRPWLLAVHRMSHRREGGTNRADGLHSHHHIVFSGEDADASASANDDDAEDVLIQVLKSNVLHNERSIQLALQAAISNASKSVCLTSSYFIPPGFLRRALHAALARGGVDVSLLLSGNSDVWGDVYATIYVVRKFLTKNSRRHSLFSAGWERGSLREITSFSDMATGLSSEPRQRPTPYAFPHLAVGSEPGGSGELQNAVPAPSHVLESSTTRSLLLPHKFPTKADADPEVQQISGDSAGTAKTSGATPLPELDNDRLAHPDEALMTPRAISASDQGTPEARGVLGEAAGGASARGTVALITSLGEERGTTESSRGRAGVYFLCDHHCHAKNIVVDHIWSSLGSFNFDRFSSRRNLEVLVTFFDPQIAYKLESFHWKRITEEAEEMTVEKWNRQPFIKKLLCSCCYYLTRFAGKNFFDGLSDRRSRAVLKRLLIASYLDDMPGADLFLGMAWGVH